MINKLCYKCKQLKPIDAFCICNKAKDGRLYMCRACKSLYDKSHYIYKGLARKDVSHLKLLTEVEKAYFAGLFDGEGCILIAKEKYEKYITYRLQISIGQNNKNLLEWVQKRFGGTMYKQIISGLNQRR